METRQLIALGLIALLLVAGAIVGAVVMRRRAARRRRLRGIKDYHLQRK